MDQAPDRIREHGLSIESRNAFVLALLLGVVLPLSVFAVLAIARLSQNGLPIDAQILQAIHAQATPARDAFMLNVTQLGTPIVVVPFVAIVASLLLIKRRPYDALFVVLAVGGSALLNQILKAVFEQARPSLWKQVVVESGYSFTSGHATASFAMAAALVVLLWHTRWRWVVLILGVAFVLIISFSRLYLGVHFPSDVLAAWCVTLAWVTIVSYVRFIPEVQSRCAR